VLTDDECTIVHINQNPFDYSYVQEAYIVDYFNNYRNGHLVMPLGTEPQWIKQGMTVLSIISEKIEKRKHHG